MRIEGTYPGISQVIYTVAFEPKEAEDLRSGRISTGAAVTACDNRTTLENTGPVHHFGGAFRWIGDDKALVTVYTD